MKYLDYIFFICFGAVAGYFMTLSMIISEIVDIEEKAKRKEKKMPTMYDDVNAVCPFFRYSDKRRISCEGIADGCVTNIEFDCKSKRDLHRRVFCDSKYQNCEIHKMLEEKYAEE